MDKKEREIRNHYCDLSERAAIKAIHKHYRIADFLEHWATRIVNNYRKDEEIYYPEYPEQNG